MIGLWPSVVEIAYNDLHGQNHLLWRSVCDLGVLLRNNSKIASSHLSESNNLMQIYSFTGNILIELSLVTLVGLFIYLTGFYRTVKAKETPL